jgi:hypothetical protein
LHSTGKYLTGQAGFLGLFLFPSSRKKLGKPNPPAGGNLLPRILNLHSIDSVVKEEQKKG